MGWYEPLRAIESKGSKAVRPGSLAGLHAARQEHEGQFFTSDALAAFVWRLVTFVEQRASSKAVNFSRSGTSLISLWDNSIGSGRLVQFADPERHAIYGCDVDDIAVAQLSKTLGEAGFKSKIELAGMEAVRASAMNIAIINPPFSCRIESPAMQPFASSAFGRYGPNTSAVSHMYAIEQALDCADVVFAILPSTFASSFQDASERLRAVYTLPAGLFANQGTQVSVALLAFGSLTSSEEVKRISIKALDEPLDDLGLSIRYITEPRVKRISIDANEPTITLPVTGDKRVKIVHDGRKIRLKFGCGFMQAKVMNDILRCRASEKRHEGHRLPKGVVYHGQGLLDAEMHVAQTDPIASLMRLPNIVRNHGGEPELSDSLLGYIKRRAKEVKRERTPLRHIVQGVDARAAVGSIGIAKKTHLADPSKWGSPVIKAGQSVKIAPDGDKYQFEVAGTVYRASRDELELRFDLIWETSAEDDCLSDGWYVAHHGRAKAFPDVAAFWRRRAISLGLDKWLSWDFQFEDTIELLISPRGAIAAWEQCLGKARLSAALCMLGGDGPGVICAPSYLVDESAAEFQKIGLNPDSWQIIDCAEKLQSLKRINLISLTRIRMPVQTKPVVQADGTLKAIGRKHTYGKALRRRVSVLVVDEGELLANSHSDQSQAIRSVSPKRCYVLSGTPIGNLPRNVLPLMQEVGGDGTAGQIWGDQHPKLDPTRIDQMAYSERGTDAFREKFVTTEWVTKEFLDDMTSSAAKREIPKLANVDKYREAIAPFVLRRLVAEPDVAKHIRIPTPDEIVTTLKWNPDHLSHYLTVADDFANWYVNQFEEKRGKNLVALLARIGAVVMANNAPQRGNDFHHYSGGLTSKQEYAINRLEEWTEDGNKNILFCHSPHTAELVARELKLRSVDSVVMHGGITKQKRRKALDEGFRYGEVPNLIATCQTCQAGYNIPQANRVLLYDRDWTFKVEDQAIKRTLRHDQKRQVLVERLHIEGSVDEYQAQMVAFKADCAKAGLDWAAPTMSDVAFVHIDTILAKFVDNLAAIRGLTAHEFREQMKWRKLPHKEFHNEFT